jgi:hemerythrin superfamily protein
MTRATIYELLKEDHRLVKSLLAKLAETTREQPDRRAELIGQVKAELGAHNEAEERVLYATLEQEDETRDAALEGVEEHRVGSRLLIELDQMRKDNERWKAKFTVFKEILEHHVDEEEDEIFSKAKKVLDDEEARELGARFEAEKKAAAR